MLKKLQKWRDARRAAIESVDWEAKALLGTKGRAGALFDLTERLRAVGLARAERRWLAALIERVHQLSPKPPKADTAIRMLYSG